MRWCSRPTTSGGPYRVLWRHFCPAARLEDLNRRTGGMAAVWVSRGELVLTDSVVTDYGAIQVALEADRDQFRVREVGLDPWNAVQLAAELADDGWTMLPMGRRPGDDGGHGGDAEADRGGPAASREHGDHALAGRQCGHPDRRVGNVKLDRQKSPEKIDGLVAAVMALDRALRRAAEAEEYAAAGW